MNPFVSIIIRAYDEENGLLFETIESIYNQSISNYEILLLYHTLKEDTLKRLSAIGGMVFLPDNGLGPYNCARYLNYACKKAKGSFFIFCCADATPVSFDWLEKLVSSTEKKGVWAVYGRQIARENAALLTKKDYSKTYKNIDGYEERIWFSNVNSCIPREYWERHPFNEEALISEDFEFAKWVLLSGGKIYYSAKAAVYHSHDLSVKDVYRRTYMEGKGLRTILNKKRTFIRFIGGYILNVVDDIMWFLPKMQIKEIFYSFAVRLADRYGMYKGYNDSK